MWGQIERQQLYSSNIGGIHVYKPLLKVLLWVVNFESTPKEPSVLTYIDYSLGDSFSSRSRDQSRGLGWTKKSYNFGMHDATAPWAP
jgi:hypothetical protein